MQRRRNNNFVEQEDDKERQLDRSGGRFVWHAEENVHEKGCFSFRLNYSHSELIYCYHMLVEW